jgi:putative transposase
MTANHRIDPAQFLSKNLERAEPDLLRSMPKTFIEALMGSGSYFPDRLLERRRRAERALTTVVATCYLLGVSTRRMEKPVETLGITRPSRSQDSNMAKELDEQRADFRSRPLDVLSASPR